MTMPSPSSAPCAPAGPPILQVDGLRFAYPGEPALVEHWSARIGAGVTQLHGDTGSGKSTLLRVLAGELPASGRLTLAGQAFDLANQAERSAWQRHVFWADPSSRDADAITARACATTTLPADDTAAGAEWKALVDGFALAPHLDKPMYMLSTGSKRKVWLAAALASRQPLILLDEPTAALDGPSIECLWRALGRRASRGEQAVLVQAVPVQAVLVASAERIDRLPLAGLIELPPA